MPHYISVSIYLLACEKALLGVGGRRGKEDPPPRDLSRRLSIWGNWRCWRLSLLKDCRLYAPHTQIWPEYKLETASCCYCKSAVCYGFLSSKNHFQSCPFIKTKCCIVFLPSLLPSFFSLLCHSDSEPSRGNKIGDLVSFHEEHNGHLFKTSCRHIE